MAASDLTAAEVRWAIAQAREHYTQNGTVEMEKALALKDEEARKARVLAVERLHARNMTACDKAKEYLFEGIEEVGNRSIWWYDHEHQCLHASSTSRLNWTYEIQNDECQCEAFLHGNICMHRAAAFAITLFYEELRRTGWTPRRPQLRKSREQIEREAEELFA
jgi:hypothetical protein